MGYTEASQSPMADGVRGVWRDAHEASQEPVGKVLEEVEKEMAYSRERAADDAGAADCSPMAPASCVMLPPSSTGT